MNMTMRMGGGNVHDDWPELDPDKNEDRTDKSNADQNPESDERIPPGPPASDPESGA
ncbi:hypothetical protein [Pseudomonas promysalinigenes]|uniref:hypothetical protein n=1 Tax=Pseudomonas promysalinigenes TaxID=485898 RepID=UPI001644AE22|nr:hypothetical protein [Pseudomonas promysalinigenes]QXI36094.1 hypothetical protein HU725_011175 [Pseudomonas promysalinigenes]